MAGSSDKYLSCMQVLPLDDEHLMGQGVPNSNWIPDPSDFKDFTPLIINKPWCWDNGSVITVKFLESKSDRVLGKIKENAALWSKYANITFNFVNSGDAMIRISFDPKTGSWSRVGKACLNIKDQTKATMNYGWFNDQTTDSEFMRTTVHEFGHALGAIHEQFSPNLKITWIKDAVYKYYKESQTPPWTEAQVDNNFNNWLPATGSNIVATPWDDKSIMHYAIKAEWNVEGITVDWNSTLSDQDKTWIAKMYPK